MKAGMRPGHPPGQAAPPPDAAPQPPNGSGLEALLALEAAARSAGTALELAHVLATDGRRIMRAAQVFVLRVRGGRVRVVAVSGQSSVDRTSPLIQDLERGLRRVRGARAGKGPIVLDREALFGEAASRHQTYPFRDFCVAPLALRDGTVFALALLARDTPWTDRDLPLVDRIACTFAHAWAALSGPRVLRSGIPARLVTPAVLALLLAAAMIPVPLAALAPVEVEARDALVVAAPLDGVVASVEVEPNAPVKAGDVLVRMVDTALRGRYEVAEQNVAVAEVRERRLAQAAFRDKAALRDLAVASAELGLARAERDAAREALERTQVRAERDGVAVFQSRKDMEGRPVATGERLMVIADPDRVEYRIELPVKDAMVAREGAPVRVYLDADPLAQFDGVVMQANFHAAPVPGGGLAFTLRARPDPAGSVPRIGFRGTAQVRGETVRLGYFLLRRPLSALRQHIGL